MDINEKQQMLNAAFKKMSVEAQEVALKFLLEFAEQHPKERHLQLVFSEGKKQLINSSLF